MRNRKHTQIHAHETVININELIRVSSVSFETVIVIDELERLAHFNLTDLPVEILAHIFSFCGVEVINNISKVNRLFFVIVISMDLMQFNMMSSYCSRVNLLDSNSNFLIFPKDISNFIRCNIPILIKGFEKNQNKLSRLKLSDFVNEIGDLNIEIDKYEIANESWTESVIEGKNRMVNLLALVFEICILMLDVEKKSGIWWLDAFLVYGVTFIVMHFGPIIIDDKLSKHKERGKELNNKVIQRFTLFKKADKCSSNSEENIFMSIDKAGGVRQFLSEEKGLQLA